MNSKVWPFLIGLAIGIVLLIGGVTANTFWALDARDSANTANDKVCKAVRDNRNTLIHIIDFATSPLPSMPGDEVTQQRIAMLNRERADFRANVDKIIGPQVTC